MAARSKRRNLLSSDSVIQQCHRRVGILTQVRHRHIPRYEILFVSGWGGDTHSFLRRLPCEGNIVKLIVMLNVLVIGGVIVAVFFRHLCPLVIQPDIRVIQHLVCLVRIRNLRSMLPYTSIESHIVIAMIRHIDIDFIVLVLLQFHELSTDERHFLVFNSVHTVFVYLTYRRPHAAIGGKGIEVVIRTAIECVVQFNKLYPLGYGILRSAVIVIVMPIIAKVGCTAAETVIQ